MGHDSQKTAGKGPSERFTQRSGRQVERLESQLRSPKPGFCSRTRGSRTRGCAREIPPKTGDLYLSNTGARPPRPLGQGGFTTKDLISAT